MISLSDFNIRISLQYIFCSIKENILRSLFDKKYLNWQNMSVDMTLSKWAIFTIGVYGEVLCLLSDPAEISFLSTLTRVP